MLLCYSLFYQSIVIMGNCSSRCATGLGIVQIVIGVYFGIGLIILPRDNEVAKRIFLASIFALFTSSGSLAIGAAWMETMGLVTAAFVLSILCSLVAFSLLIFFAAFCYNANHGWQWWKWLWQELSSWRTLPQAVTPKWQLRPPLAHEYELVGWWKQASDGPFINQAENFRWVKRPKCCCCRSRWFVFSCRWPETRRFGRFLGPGTKNGTITSGTRPRRSDAPAEQSSPMLPLSHMIVLF